MKKEFLTKSATYLMAGLAFTLFTAGMCESDPKDDPKDDPIDTPSNPSNPSTPSTTYKDKWFGLVNEDKKSVNVDGNTLTYGNHTYTVKGEIDYNATEHKTPTAWVEFTNIPSGYTEFKAVYEGLLGKSVPGTAAMIPMAEEIYARDFTTGEKCFKLLCNSDATVSGILRILKTKIVLSKYSDENDQYIQRYLPAALLQGATYTNAYAPDEPYTVAMCSHVTPPQEVSITADGTVYYIYILTSGGWGEESFQRGMEIYQNWDGGLYKVWNCPNAYVQCRNIRGTWAGLK